MKAVGISSCGRWVRTNRAPARSQCGADVLLQVIRGVVDDHRGGVGADGLRDLGAEGVGDLLGPGLRPVDADEPRGVAAAAGQSARGLPSGAEPDEPRHLRPVGAIEQPEVGRHTLVGEDQHGARGLLHRQPRARMTAEVDAVEGRPGRARRRGARRNRRGGRGGHRDGGGTPGDSGNPPRDGPAAPRRRIDRRAPWPRTRPWTAC